jgi:hypothetical protein
MRVTVEYGKEGQRSLHPFCLQSLQQPQAEAQVQRVCALAQGSSQLVMQSDFGPRFVLHGARQLYGTSSASLSKEK